MGPLVGPGVAVDISIDDERVAARQLWLGLVQTGLGGRADAQIARAAAAVTAMMSARGRGRVARRRGGERLRRVGRVGLAAHPLCVSPQEQRIVGVGEWS